MKTSRKGIMSIMRHEGVVLSRYKDAVGVWTIGVGHTANAGKPDPVKVTWQLSMSEVMDILKTDLAKFEARVNKAVKVPISQHEFDALVSFDFNTGGVHRAALTRHLNAGNRKAAAAAFMNWTKAGGKVLPALEKRRKEERAIFERGAYPDAVASVYPATSAGRVLWSQAKRVNLETVIDDIKPVEPQKQNPDKSPIETPKPSTGGILGILAGILAAIFKRKQT